MKHSLSLEQAFFLLPKKAKQIAKFLTALNLKGEQGSSQDCPLAAWFDYCGQEVNIFPAQVHQRSETNKGVDTYMNMPPGMIKFIKRFDQGKYPKLREK